MFKGKKLFGIPLVLAVVLIISLLSVVALAAATFTLNQKVPATVKIVDPGGSPGGGGSPPPAPATEAYVYVDASCTTLLGSLNFGDLNPGASNTIVAYVKTAEINTISGAAYVTGTTDAFTQGTVSVTLGSEVGVIAKQVLIKFTAATDATPSETPYNFDAAFTGSGSS